MYCYFTWYEYFIDGFGINIISSSTSYQTHNKLFLYEAVGIDPDIVKKKFVSLKAIIPALNCLIYARHMLVLYCATKSKC